MAGGRTTHQQKLTSSVCQTDQEGCKERGMGLLYWFSSQTLPYNAGGAGSISGLGTKIPHASEPPKSEHKQQKQYCNKFNKDLKKKKKKEPRGKLSTALRKTVSSKRVSQVPHQCFSLSVKPSGVSFIPLLPSHLLNNKKSTVKALIGFIG